MKLTYMKTIISILDFRKRSQEKIGPLLGFLKGDYKGLFSPAGIPSCRIVPTIARLRAVARISLREGPNHEN